MFLIIDSRSNIRKTYVYVYNIIYDTRFDENLTFDTLHFKHNLRCIYEDLHLDFRQTILFEDLIVILVIGLLYKRNNINHESYKEKEEYKSIHSGVTFKTLTCHIFLCHIIATSTKQEHP